MLYFMRHGETEYNRWRRFQGARDIPLNEKGRCAARAVAAQIPEGLCDRIVCSTLSRARETGEILAAKLGVPIVFDHRLCEIRMDDWSGKTVDALEEDSRWRVFLEQPDLFAGGSGGEGIFEVRKRVQSLLDDLPKKEDILLVTHGYVMLVLMSILTNRSLREVRADAYIENCELIAFNRVTGELRRNILGLPKDNDWNEKRDVR